MARLQYAGLSPNLRFIELKRYSCHACLQQEFLSCLKNKVNISISIVHQRLPQQIHSMLYNSTQSKYQTTMMGGKFCRMTFFFVLLVPSGNTTDLYFLR
jgi:hypothetical protein